MIHDDLPHLVLFEDQWFTRAVAWDGKEVLKIGVDRKEGFHEVSRESPASFLSGQASTEAKRWLREVLANADRPEASPERHTGPIDAGGGPETA